MLNRYSFLVFGAYPEPEDYLNFASTGITPTSAAVVIAPGESYLVYFPLEVSGTTFSSTSIDLVADNGKTLAYANIGNMTGVDVGQGVMHYQLAFTIPGAANTKHDGYYRLRLASSSGFVYSNRLLLKTSGATDMSCLFNFANIDPIGPIAWDVSSMANFRQILRLKCNLNKPQNETNVTSYQEESTGVVRTVEIVSNRFMPFSCPFCDPFADDGWTTLLAHKSLYVNGVSMSLKTGYTATQDIKTGLGMGSFELWNNEYALLNRC